MRYIVTVTDADTCEVIERSEESVERRYLVAEGRDVAESAWRILVARERLQAEEER
jgi:hypothetical protein